MYAEEPFVFLSFFSGRVWKIHFLHLPFLQGISFSPRLRFWWIWHGVSAGVWKALPGKWALNRCWKGFQMKTRGHSDYQNCSNWYFLQKTQHQGTYEGSTRREARQGARFSRMIRLATNDLHIFTSAVYREANIRCQGGGHGLKGNLAKAGGGNKGSGRKIPRWGVSSW